jgi:hypothetical protein
MRVGATVVARGGRDAVHGTIVRHSSSVGAALVVPNGATKAMSIDVAALHPRAAVPPPRLDIAAALVLPLASLACSKPPLVADVASSSSSASSSSTTTATSSSSSSSSSSLIVPSFANDVPAPLADGVRDAALKVLVELLEQPAAARAALDSSAQPIRDQVCHLLAYDFLLPTHPLMFTIFIVVDFGKSCVARCATRITRGACLGHTSQTLGHCNTANLCSTRHNNSNCKRQHVTSSMTNYVLLFLKNSVVYCCFFFFAPLLQSCDIIDMLLIV